LTGITYPNGKWDARVGIAIILILITPPVRRMMESDMAFHMLLQFPLIFFAGWLFAKGLSEPARSKLQKWNHAGITGLLLSSMILMFWMIPKALDDVLISHAMELLKFLSLALAGVVIELSWQAAGMIMRGFFLGNVLPMMMVVGWLYIAAPVRLCNAYLTNDQLRTGRGLLALAICASLIWLFAFFMQNAQAESASEYSKG
jgi:predicted membrane channel-forming protein YqfA (hemolysin III family)